MDENSCENETSDGQKAKETENAPPLENVGIRLNLGGKQKSTEGTFDSSVSGPSTVLQDDDEDDDRDKTKPVVVESRSFVGATQNAESQERITENEMEGNTESFNTPERSEGLTSICENTEPPENSGTVETAQVPIAPVQGNERTAESAELPRYSQEFQPRLRLASSVKEQLGTRKLSIGPPPSYSFVMKQKKRLKSVPSVDPTVVNTPPPPSYTGSRGMFIPPEERFCNLPSLADPRWRSHSQPALCPRCGIIVLTTTHTHDSIATYVSSVALCLLGCWPCCLIPYFMNACKSTYHHCPICQTFLGLHKPW